MLAYGVVCTISAIKNVASNKAFANAVKANYPPNNGAVPGTESKIELQPGTYGRYGEIGPKSKFVTEAGASPIQLSLPPWTDPNIYTEITVLKPIPNVVQSTIAPWAPWNGIGGGLHYILPKPLSILKKLGYLTY